MKYILVIASAFFASSIVNSGAVAQEMICSISEAQACVPFEGCKRVPPRELNVPTMMRVDLAKREMASASMLDKGRKETIEGVKEMETAYYMHGQQEERSWSAAVSKQDGVLSVNISGVGESFVLFGQCANN